MKPSASWFDRYPNWSLCDLLNDGKRRGRGGRTPSLSAQISRNVYLLDRAQGAFQGWEVAGAQSLDARLGVAVERRNGLRATRVRGPREAANHTPIWKVCTGLNYTPFLASFASTFGGQASLGRSPWRRGRDPWYRPTAAG